MGSIDEGHLISALHYYKRSGSLSQNSTYSVADSQTVNEYQHGAIAAIRLSHTILLIITPHHGSKAWYIRMYVCKKGRFRDLEI